MSITLTNPKKVAVNDIVMENNTQGADVDCRLDYITNNITFTLQIGAVGTGQQFLVGQYSIPISVTVNAANGNWAADNGAKGNVSGQALVNLVAQLKALRNLIETFAAGTATLMPGTQVPW